MEKQGIEILLKGVPPMGRICFGGSAIRAVILHREHAPDLVNHGSGYSMREPAHNSALYPRPVSWRNICISLKMPIGRDFESNGLFASAMSIMARVDG